MTRAISSTARFEGMYIAGDGAPDAVAELELRGWIAEAPFADGGVAVIPPGPVDHGGAWRLTGELRARHPRAFVEPLWETILPEEPDAPLGFEAVDPLAGGRGIWGDTEPPEDRRWHVGMLDAVAAWELVPPAGGERRGRGILIGQIDTGYRLHGEIAAWDPASGWDILDNDDDPLDDLVDGTLRFPGHGLATGSVLASSGTGALCGAAPEARVIPFRVSTSVVHLSMCRMVRGIDRAIRAGCHVISISAGGMWSRALRREIRRAHEAGIIVVAATGNYVRFVVWPARYPEVIACGAVDHAGDVWAHSCGGAGDRVDVLAPGVDVWVARPDDPAAIAPGSGTSFATACVSGAIATWLAYHGRDALVARYGAARLPSVAHQMVRDAVRPLGGISAPPGILDLKRLLEAPLPHPGELEALDDASRDHEGLFGEAGAWSAEAVVARGGIDDPLDPRAPLDDEQAFYEVLAAIGRA